jgi:hypothetical protein
LGNLPQEYSGPHASLQSATDDIWHPSEAEPQRVQDYDPRKVPEYEMLFKQAVSAEDVYLGVNYINLFPFYIIKPRRKKTEISRENNDYRQLIEQVYISIFIVQI